MSHVLESMWMHRDQAGNLTLRAYEAAGGIEGSVNRAAENAWKVLDDDDRAVAPALLLRLVQIGDGARDTRRAVPGQNCYAWAARMPAMAGSSKRSPQLDYSQSTTQAS